MSLEINRNRTQRSLILLISFSRFSDHNFSNSFWWWSWRTSTHPIFIFTWFIIFKKIFSMFWITIRYTLSIMIEIIFYLLTLNFFNLFSSLFLTFYLSIIFPISSLFKLILDIIMMTYINRNSWCFSCLFLMHSCQFIFVTKSAAIFFLRLSPKFMNFNRWYRILKHFIMRLLIFLLHRYKFINLLMIKISTEYSFPLSNLNIQTSSFRCQSPMNISFTFFIFLILLTFLIIFFLLQFIFILKILFKISHNCYSLC